MDEIQTGAAEAVADTTPALSLEETIANTMEATFEKIEAGDTAESTGPTRDATGRFVSNTPAETAPESEAAPAETKDTDQPAKAADAPAQPASGPPQSWSAAAKAEWAKLSPALQAEIAKREGDVQKGFEQKAAETRPHVEFAQTVRQRFEPFRQEMAQRGVNEIQAIDYLVSMEQFARRDPEGYIRHVASELKIPLDRLVSPARETAAPTDAYVDPEVAQLKSTVNNLVQRVQNQDRAAATQRQTEAQSAINAFKADPANKHFDKVTTDMAVLIQSGRATSLKDAYEKAIWANAETRAEILAEQRKEEEAKRIKEAEEAAKKARKAAGTPLSQRGSPATVRSGARSIDDTMNEAYDRATGRA